MSNKTHIFLFKRGITAKKEYKSGFSLVEVVISALILSVVTTGLAYLLFAGKRQTLHSRARIQSSQLGKLFLSPLQLGVRSDTWSSSSNPLYAGTYYCDGVSGHTQHPSCPSTADRTIEGIVYAATYTITRDSPISNVNKVKVDITWTEPTS